MILLPTPYTLHPTPYTLIPYTLHPTPYALHPPALLHALHPPPYTLHPTPCTLHSLPYTLILNPQPQTCNPQCRHRGIRQGVAAPAPPQRSRFRFGGVGSGLAHDLVKKSKRSLPTCKRNCISLETKMKNKCPDVPNLPKCSSSQSPLAFLWQGFSTTCRGVWTRGLRQRIRVSIPTVSRAAS